MLHAGRQDVAILRRAWNTEINQRLRHPDRRRVRRRQRAGRVREPARLDPRPPRRQDRQLHALGRSAADRRAAQLRRRGRRPPARAGRRAAAAADRERPARVGARGVPPARVGDRRARPRDRLGAAAARRPARPASSRGRPRARRLARAHRDSEDRPVGSVLADPPLVELAKRQPSDLRGLEQIRGIHPSERPPPRRGDPRGDRRAAARPQPIPREPARGAPSPATRR